MTTNIINRQQTGDNNGLKTASLKHTVNLYRVQACPMTDNCGALRETGHSLELCVVSSPPASLGNMHFSTPAKPS